MSDKRDVSDALWNKIKSAIPPRPSRARGGRPPADDRKLLNAILYIARTGAAWRDLPTKYGPWQTAYDRFSEWRNANVFEQMWAAGLKDYADKHGIEWEWQSSDGTYVRSPLGGKR